MARSSDLIVMATDARGIGGRVVGGCTCDRVARHAPAPTLLVRAGRHGINAQPLSRIVVPLDGSPEAEAALRPAWALAALLGAPVHLVHVLEPVGTLPTDRQPSETYLTDVMRRAETGAHLTWEIRDGEPSVEIATAVQPGDLLVMTTHGAGGMRRWFMGTVAERLIRQAPVPVLVARETSLDTLPATAVDTAPAWW
jgi:nucleotide-binding universal stress UspA family protein